MSNNWNQVVIVSATPINYELQKDGLIVEHAVSQTRLFDPPIELCPSINQIDDLLEEIDKPVKRKVHVLVATLFKRMPGSLENSATASSINLEEKIINDKKLIGKNYFKKTRHCFMF